MSILLITIGAIYLVMLTLSIIYLIKPPKKINGIYGYRTVQSTKNIENWLYSNKLASRYLIVATHLILIVSLISCRLEFLGYLSFIQSFFLVTIIIPLISFVALIWIIEMKLKKKNAKD